MINLVRADLFTLLRSRGLLLCFVFSAAAAALFIWFGAQIAAGTMEGADGSGPGSLFADVLIVHLLGALVAGSLIIGDFETRTIHDVLLAARRGQVVAAKTVVYLLVVSALVLPYAVAAVVALLAQWQIAPFLPTTLLQVAAEGAPVTGQSVTTAVVLGLATMVSYAGQLAVVLPLSFIIRKPVAITGIGFVWGFAADTLAGLAEKGSVAETLLGLTPYGQVRDLTPASSGADILTSVLVSVAFIAVMAFLAWLQLRRMDVK